MRPEHAPVVVALVDDHHVEMREQAPVALVSGQQRVVQHVRVREDVAGRAPRPLAFGRARVAVERRRLEPGQSQLTQGAELVVGERLGRGEIERRPPSSRRQRQVVEGVLSDRQQVPERLARRRARRDDHMATSPDGGRGLDLMRPRPGDAARHEAATQLGPDPGRPGLRSAFPAGHHVDAHRIGVTAAPPPFQQRGERLPRRGGRGGDRGHRTSFAAAADTWGSTWPTRWRADVHRSGRRFDAP